jgi:hypothetical protein
MFSIRQTKEAEQQLLEENAVSSVVDGAMNNPAAAPYKFVSNIKIEVM